MAGVVLHQGVTIGCPHGGTGTVTPGHTSVYLDGRPALRVSDPVTIAGCAFTVGTVPQPCVRVQWQAPATRFTVKGAAVLLSTSIGLCVNAAGAPQGPARVSGQQTRVSGR